MGRSWRRAIPTGLCRWVFTLALGAAAPVPAATDAAPAGVLVVEVTGVPSAGMLHLEIYDASTQEKWGAPLRRERFPVQPKAAAWRVEGLPPGDYAVRVFLDQNGNGSLDRGRSGIPTEPFGFSN